MPLKFAKTSLIKFGFKARMGKATTELFDEIKKAIPDFEKKDFLKNDRFLFDDIKKLTDNYESFVYIAEKSLVESKRIGRYPIRHAECVIFIGRHSQTRICHRHYQRGLSKIRLRTVGNSGGGKLETSNG